MEPQILDWQEGVARVVSNRALYGRLLGKFAETQADAPDLAAAALAEGDMEKARLVVHTLKGTAANLSAHALADAALTLETAIKTGADATDALEHTKRVMVQTLEAMKQFQA